jgi:hypothetical protein
MSPAIESTGQEKVTAAIISTRPGLVIRCLRSLLQQSLAPELYTILVVADYDDELVREPLVRWIHGAPKSIAGKRTIALRETKTELIAFTDDDCVADTNWLKKGMEYLAEHPEEVGVQGRIVVPEIREEGPNLRENKRLERPLFQTSNIFYRTVVLREVGGFDARFSFQREDVDLGFTLLQAGFRTGFEAEAVVQHPVRSGEYWDLIKTAYRKRFDPLLRYKHPELFSAQLGSLLPGSFIVMIIAWLLVPAGFFVPRVPVLGAPVLLAASAILLTVRRHWKTGGWLKYGPASFASMLVAPLVAAFVIIIGLIRWRGVKK